MTPSIIPNCVGEFQQQNVFENSYINQICDSIFERVKSVFHRTTDIVICGSVAKVLSKELPQNYQAKDLDFVVRDYLVWRFLREHLQEWFVHCPTQVREKERVILFCPIIAIEFWLSLKDQRKTQHITPNIKYIDYAH